LKRENISDIWDRGKEAEGVWGWEVEGNIWSQRDELTGEWR